MRFSIMDEVMFQNWYKNLPIVLSGKMNPNPDDPEHFYDMRSAWLNSRGLNPDLQGHFPSEFKKIGHPRYFLGGVDTRDDFQAGQEVADLLDPENLAMGTRNR